MKKIGINFCIFIFQQTKTKNINTELFKKRKVLLINFTIKKHYEKEEFARRYKAQDS